MKEFGIKIAYGFELKGIIQILGYSVSCRIKISIPDILIDVQMSPMTLGDGLFAVHRSLKDSTNGPEFHVKISKEDFVVDIKGAICFLGVQAEAVVKISKKEFYLKMNVDLFGIIKGNLLVQATKEGFKVCCSTVIPPIDPFD